LRIKEKKIRLTLHEHDDDDDDDDDEFVLLYISLLNKTIKTKDVQYIVVGKEI
jgi:hypothetical protein